MTDRDLLRLAQIFGANQHLSYATISARATDGANREALDRLRLGRRIHRTTRAKLGEFFRRDWPPFLDWPSDVEPRHRRCGRAA